MSWLCTVDPSSNHNRACELHEPGTGRWLTESQDFAQWWKGESRLLFLTGIPGSGKTILSSTVIEQVKALIRHENDIGFAYFYFDFNDEPKQLIDGFLSCILRQLSCQKMPLPDGVRNMYDQYYSSCSRPKRASLIETLFSVAKSFRKVFVVVDALDECKHTYELACFIIKIFEEGPGNIYILGSSRKEQSLEVIFQDSRCRCISLNGSHVDDDIALHIRSKLATDHRLKAWPVIVKQEIEQVLVQGACGMYEISSEHAVLSSQC